MYIFNKQKQIFLSFIYNLRSFCKLNFTYNYFRQISEDICEKKIGMSSNNSTAANKLNRYFLSALTQTALGHQSGNHSLCA